MGSSIRPHKAGADTSMRVNGRRTWRSSSRRLRNEVGARLLWQGRETVPQLRTDAGEEPERKSASRKERLDQWQTLSKQRDWTKSRREKARASRSGSGT